VHPWDLASFAVDVVSGRKRRIVCAKVGENMVQCYD